MCFLRHSCRAIDIYCKKKRLVYNSRIIQPVFFFNVGCDLRHVGTQINSKVSLHNHEINC